MFVECVPIDLAEIARLVDDEQHTFHESIEPTEQLHWRYGLGVPHAHRNRHWVQDGVLADAGGAAEQERMIDLLSRLLAPVRAIGDDVLPVFGIDGLDMVKPSLCFARISRL